MSPSLPLDAVARLVAHDGSLFSDDAVVAAEASAYMGWTHLARDASDILPAIEAFAAAARAEGLTDVVLMGMGGSSLAALVMGDMLAPGSPKLHVVDTTSPIAVSQLLAATDAATTMHVVSSKSGGTVEPNALYAIFRERADLALGRSEAGRRFVAITDPGSSLEGLASADRMRACFLTPADVGGRYSALTAFGLLPAALAGIDVRMLVERALEVERGFTDGEGETGLAEMMSRAHAQGADKLRIVAPPRIRVFGLWVEQLVAESLGKHGSGIVPSIALGDSSGLAANEIRFAFGRDDREAGSAEEAWRMTLTDPYDIGGWFVLWEYSTALAGAVMRVDPFDQPNVAEAKDATASVLAGQTVLSMPDVAVDGVEITFAGGLPEPQHPERSLTAVLGHTLDALRDGDYFAILAYLPGDDTLLRPLGQAVDAVRAATGTATCLEIGPRYLHSTGQLHKGGPNTGVFVMVTTRDPADLTVPGQEWTLRDLHCAQAEGDFAVLATHGRRVLRVTLADASEGSIRTLSEALQRAVSEYGSRRDRR